MRSPESSPNRASISLREFSPSVSFADAKKSAARYDAPAKVFEDTEKRYWYQSRGATSVLTEWQVVVPGKPSCALHIGFNNPDLERLARQIAQTLRSAGSY
jgi:hypothetical protein